MMKRFVAAALAVGLMTAAASAEPPAGLTGMGEPRLAGVHDGGYVGLMSGINAAALNAPEGPDWADTGLFGGVYVGYGLVTSGTYLGVEVDGMIRDIRPSQTDGETTVSFSNRWMASARLRAGVPIGPALLYATGGVALQESVLKYTDPGLSASDAEMIMGAVVGAGIEAKITRTVALRLEGRHYRWQDQTFQIGDGTAKLGQDDTMVLLGVSFSLN